MLGDIMKIKRILLSLAVVFGLTSFGSVANAACGNITIANMNWASANFMAEVDKIILEEGYGCSVELVPGATMPTFTSMQEKGEPDVAPEFWANAAIIALNKAVDEGKMHSLNKAPITGLGEGWWVLPATLEKHPELTTAEAILARPDLFPHPEDPSKGGFHICPPGWNCELSNRNHFRAWEMEKKGWKIVETGSAAGLDGSIAKAAERGENWFGYYWSPTSLIGKYNMQAVDEGKMHSLNKAPITGLGEGWWVLPHTLKKHPELTTAEAILARPDLFPHPEDPSKGGFHICPPGWNCELSNRNLYKAFDMEAKGWAIVETGSAAGLDGSIAKAAERGENWFGYYWSPTAIIGKYDMRAVDMGAWGGKDNWDKCIVLPEQECGDPKATSWTKSEVYTIVTDNFKNTAGSAGMEYFKKRTYPGPVMNGMLVWMGENQAEGADAAIEFLKTQESVWSKWVSSDAAKKIKKAL